MKLTTCAAIALGSALVALAVAHAQPAPIGEAPNVRVLGTVVKGNTTIEFQAANPSDLDIKQLRTWGDFAGQHADIARELGNKPSLMQDAGYLKKHPELSAFFTEHPEIRDAMNENPGNFVAPQHGGSQ